MAAEGAPEWSIAAAGHQTAGRGRLGRTWEDRPGHALMWSVLLRPSALAAEDAGLVPLMAGVALAGACRSITGLDVRCKWPNDLQLDGAKVGGILVESRVAGRRLEVAVVGSGLNLEPPEGVEGAGGLGAGVDPEALLTAYLRELVALYDRASAGDPGAVTNGWRALSATLGRDVGATTLDGRMVQGMAVDLDARGGLIVETSGGPVTVAFGEVEHLG